MSTGVVSQQGADSSPEGLPAKLVFISVFFFGMITFQAFSANIVTTLTSTKSINNFQELIEYKDIKIFASEFPPFRQEIFDSKNSLVKGLKRRILEDDHKRPKDAIDPDILDHMAFMRDDTTAFVAPEDFMLMPFVFCHNKYRDIACRLTKFRVPMGGQLVMYGMRKGLPQKQKIQEAFIRLKETGVKARMDKTYRASKPDCNSVGGTGFRQVALKYVNVAFAILGIGFTIAAGLCVVEKLHYDLVRADER